MEARRGTSKDRESVLPDLLRGAAAGGIAVWVMNRVDWSMYDHEDPEARRRTQSARPGGLDPAHVVANKVAGALGAELSPPQPHPAGAAVHYAIGIGPAALYGALQDRVPAVGIGRGALFGLGLFLVQDELLNSVTGLSGRPRDYPWQAHARGLVAHVVFGMVTDTVLRVLKGPGRQARGAAYAPEGRAAARPRHTARPEHWEHPQSHAGAETRTTAHR